MYFCLYWWSLLFVIRTWTYFCGRKIDKRINEVLSVNKELFDSIDYIIPLDILNSLKETGTSTPYSSIVINSEYGAFQ